MKKYLNYFVMLALIAGLSACEKDQQTQNDDFAGVELKGTVLNGKGGVLGALYLSEVDFDSKTFKEMTSYNGNKKVWITEGIFIQKGAQIEIDGKPTTLADLEFGAENGNGNTTWVVFEHGSKGIVTIGYKWGNIYRAWIFNAEEVAEEGTAVFVFDGRPLSGIVYDIWVPCEVDTKALEGAMKDLQDFIEDNEGCLDEAYEATLLALYGQGSALVEDAKEAGKVKANSKECNDLTLAVYNKKNEILEALEGPHVWKVLRTELSILVIQGNNEKQAREALEKLVPAELVNAYINLAYYPAIGEPRSIVVLEGIFDIYCAGEKPAVELGDEIVFFGPVQNGNSTITFTIKDVNYSFRLGGFPSHAERRRISVVK